MCGRIFKKFSHVKFLFENRLIFADLRQQSSGSPDQPPSECHTKRKHKPTFGWFEKKNATSPRSTEGSPFLQDAERRPKRPEALGSPVDAHARARALSRNEIARLECRRLYLATPASFRLPLEQTTTMLPSLSRSKEIFARASRSTEICTPQVDNFADLAKFTSISKRRFAS